jgi:hypothetical protein
MSHVGQGEVQAAEAREDPVGTGEVWPILIWVICITFGPSLFSSARHLGYCPHA